MDFTAGSPVLLFFFIPLHCSPANERRFGGTYITHDSWQTSGSFFLRPERSPSPGDARVYVIYIMLKFNLQRILSIPTQEDVTHGRLTRSLLYNVLNGFGSRVWIPGTTSEAGSVPLLGNINKCLTALCLLSVCQSSLPQAHHTLTLSPTAISFI